MPRIDEVPQGRLPLDGHVSRARGDLLRQRCLSLSLGHFPLPLGLLSPQGKVQLASVVGEIARAGAARWSRGNDDARAFLLEALLAVHVEEGALEGL